MKILRYVFVVVFCVIHPVYADQFCFALAETYYEQVYCQLQAKAQTKGLPAFNQFQKNTESVQASLLKRPAERNGIKLLLPTRKVQPPGETITPTKTVGKLSAVVAKPVANEPSVAPS